MATAVKWPTDRNISRRERNEGTLGDRGLQRIPVRSNFPGPYVLECIHFQMFPVLHIKITGLIIYIVNFVSVVPIQSLVSWSTFLVVSG